MSSASNAAAFFAERYCGSVSDCDNGGSGAVGLITYPSGHLWFRVWFYFMVDGAVLQSEGSLSSILMDLMLFWSLDGGLVSAVIEMGWCFGFDEEVGWCDVMVVGPL